MTSNVLRTLVVLFALVLGACTEGAVRVEYNQHATAEQAENARLEREWVERQTNDCRADYNCEIIDMSKWRDGSVCTDAVAYRHWYESRWGYDHVLARTCQFRPNVVFIVRGGHLGRAPLRCYIRGKLPEGTLHHYVGECDDLTYDRYYHYHHPRWKRW